MGRLRKTADALEGHVSKKEKEKRRAAETRNKVGNDGLQLAPEFLSEEGKAEFLRVVDECNKAGILDNLDRTILAVYADAWSQYERLSKVIANTGAVIIKRRVTGKIEIHPNPAVAAQAEYANRIFKCSTKLGLSTSDRMRLVVPELEEKTNKFLSFINSDDDED